MCSCKHRHTHHMWCSIWPKAFRFKSPSVHITQTVLYLEISDPLHILGLMYFLTSVTPSSFCWLTLPPLLTSCLTSDNMVDERWVFIWCIELMSTPDKHTDRWRSEKQMMDRRSSGQKSHDRALLYGIRQDGISLCVLILSQMENVFFSFTCVRQPIISTWKKCSIRQSIRSA